MSTSDWVFGVVVGPVIVALLWYVAWLVWTRGLRVDAAVGGFASDRRVRGYHAFLAPTTLAMTVFVTGIDLMNFGVLDSEGRTYGYLMVGGLAVMAVAGWLFFTAWPRFLVPPHLRNETMDPKQPSVT